ncbi:MAG: pre-peptidase C-terminal domain-containing protein [Candidatus Hodarchaeota archaeon]
MKFNKNYKRGLSLIFLLLIVVSGIKIVRNISNNNLTDGIAPPISAVNDGYEPNNDFWGAWYLSPSYYSSLIIEGYEEDWFRTYLNPGETIEIYIYFIHSDGDLDLELYDPSNNPRTGSYSSYDYEYISFTADMSGDWAIRIYRLTGSIDEYYDLDILVYTGDDWMEENDDYGSAYSVSPGYYSPLKIVGYDEDWFRTYLNPGETIEIYIYFIHSDGDLDLELYDPSNNPRTGSYSSYDYEYISFTADMSGDWAIRIYRLTGSIDEYYDLDILVYTGGSTMDPFEPNDGFWRAAPITPGGWGGLSIIGTDEDWFQIYLNTGEVIDVVIFFEHKRGNLQLELYDPSNNQRAGSYSSTENDGWSKEHIKYRAKISGDWRIRVYHATSDSDVQYDLEVNKLDDWYESNDWYDQAYNLKDDEYTWLSDIGGLALQESEDWYYIEVTPGFEHLIVNVKFNLSLGNIYVDIYEFQVQWHSTNWITSNYSMSGDDNIDIDILLPYGAYFIQIGGDYIRQEYDLWWDDIRTDFRPDDNYEENDAASAAFDISFYPDTELKDLQGYALQYDNDWYRILVYSGYEHLFVKVTFDYQEGAIGIEIYDSGIYKKTSNFTESDNEFIDYVVPSNGTYFIRIFGDNSGNVYTLKWTTRAPETPELIPGYDAFILFSVIFGVTTIIILQLKRSKKHRKEFF